MWCCGVSRVTPLGLGRHLQADLNVLRITPDQSAILSDEDSFIHSCAYMDDI